MANDTRNDLDGPSTGLISTAVYVLSFAAFGSGMSQRIADPLLPQLAADFAVSLGTAAWTITSFTVGYAVFQLFFGPVGDRYGKYVVVAWSCAACCAAAVLCGLAPNLAALFVARALAGATTGAIIPLAMAWIGDVVPYDRRQPVLARFLIGHLSGTAAGQLLGGLSADYLGRRIPFFIVAACFAISSVLLFAVRRRLPLHAQATYRADGHPLQRMWREFAAVLMQPWARVVLLTVGFEAAMIFAAYAFFATHLHHTLNVSLTLAGSIAMGFGFGGLIFAAASRRLVKRLGESGLVRSGGIVASLSLGLMAWAPNIVLAVLGCCTLGVGFYMVHNTLQTNATQMAPERRGAAVSAFALTYFVGQSCGVALAGWAVPHIGTAGVTLIAALGIAVIGFQFANAKRRHVAA